MKQERNYMKMLLEALSSNKKTLREEEEKNLPPYYEDENFGDEKSKVSNYDIKDYDPEQNIQDMMKGNRTKHDWQNLGGKLKIADGVKISIRDQNGDLRTLRGGMYKLKPAWENPEDYYGVYSWADYDQHIGDVEIDKIVDLIKKGKAVANRPMGSR